MDNVGRESTGTRFHFMNTPEIALKKLREIIHKWEHMDSQHINATFGADDDNGHPRDQHPYGHLMLSTHKATCSVTVISYLHDTEPPAITICIKLYSNPRD